MGWPEWIFPPVRTVQPQGEGEGCEVPSSSAYVHGTLELSFVFNANERVEQRPNPKKNMVSGTLWHLKFDYSLTLNRLHHIYHGQPYCQSWHYPPVRDLGFGLGIVPCTTILRGGWIDSVSIINCFIVYSKISLRSHLITKFIVPDWGDKVHSGIGLSYRHARLHRLAGRYDNPMAEFISFPEAKS